MRILKSEIVVEIAGALRHEPPKMSTGSTEPRAIFDLANECLGLGLSPQLTKPELARGIVEAAGYPWNADYESRGGTVTLPGLVAVRDAVRLFVGSGPSPKVDEDSTKVDHRPIPQYVPPHPGASSKAVSRRMTNARRRDTAPEVALRREIHALGFRYRVAYPIPGQRRRTIDLAFTRCRVAVFVDGCFWHGCPEHGTNPQQNSEWWLQKFRANRTRDLDTNRILDELGWTVVRVWEHEDPKVAAALVGASIDAARLRLAHD